MDEALAKRAQTFYSQPLRSVRSKCGEPEKQIGREAIGMSEILFHYHKVHPATWVYLSSLLTIGLFFKFNRFWSVRNVDLLLLILLAPGMLLVHFGGQLRRDAVIDLTRAGYEIPKPPSIREELSSSIPVLPSADRDRDLNSSNNLTGSGNSENQSDRESRGNREDQGSSNHSGDSDLSSSGHGAGEERLPSDQVGSGGESADGSEAESDRGELEQRYASAVRNERRGYVWLFTVGGLLLLRLLLDPTMVRRPLLEPNLSTGGLAFIGVSLFVFLMANVLTSTPTQDDLQGPRGAAELISRLDPQDAGESLRRHGPGYALLHVFPSLPTIGLRREVADSTPPLVTAAKAMAMFSQLAIIVGLVGIGWRHFNNLQAGIGVATLYLMLPYTAVMTGRVDHVLPAALLVWALLFYRRPLVAGIFIGLAAGVVYYPMFLLPLWVSFYWRRGLARFSIGVLAILALMVISLIFVSADWVSFVQKVKQMFGIWRPLTDGLEGIWGLGWDANYRLPILALFVAMSLTLAIWPAQKNLGTLMSCSAAVMVATQFWHGYGGGIYMAWYLPLTLLTVFRPNLEDRVALTVLGKGWLAHRRPQLTMDRAA